MNYVRMRNDLDWEQDIDDWLVKSVKAGELVKECMIAAFKIPKECFENDVARDKTHSVEKPSEE